MSGEFLGDRRHALEEAFFAQQDAALRRRLAETDSAQARRAQIAASTGIADPAVIDALAKLDIPAETMAALGLVPLVLVAWADGAIDAKEREAVLKAAADSGIKPGESAHALLESWLKSAPPASLRTAWAAYIAGVTATMDAAGRQAFRTQLLARARSVAEAAGGFLGLGAKISPAEEKLLTELERAFS